MNKQDLSQFSLNGTVWITSDIHLGPHIPLTCRFFYEFLAKAQQGCDHLILNGDIFNAWVGDDLATHDPEPWLQEAIKQLQAFSQHKPLYLVRGNRDFFLGKQLANLVNGKLMPDRFVLINSQQKFLISHGDEYCTDDKGYMFFRGFSRIAWLQKLFLCLPLSFRKKIGQRVRARSQKKYQRLSHSQVLINRGDVSETAIRDTLRAHPDIPWLVHGHTHRPHVHHYQMNACHYERWVNSDWELDHPPYRADYFEIKKGVIRRHDLLE
ncbi:UDP-2,3-diacylglucosamine diphosphatase [Brackiella oedipodis]|uniref:UDP-2,3-diacylglucosamine diphosphatase n=1 Tax=Brackiella oedipodis TaxID=124225 RepID=UPI00056FB133|nr:UDP-2,3-diacylglucosamine diphosphatase [Brackiella oedipodis]